MTIAFFMILCGCLLIGDTGKSLFLAVALIAIGGLILCAKSIGKGG